MIRRRPSLFAALTHDELHQLRVRVAGWWCEADVAYDRRRDVGAWHLRNDFRDMHRDVRTELQLRRARSAHRTAQAA